MMRAIWHKAARTMVARTLVAATTLIVLYAVCGIGSSIAGEKPRLHLAQPHGVDVVFSDYVSGGCFLRPKTAKDYFIEKLSVRDFNIVDKDKLPNIKLVISFFGDKERYGYCHVVGEMSIYYTIEYVAGGYVYDGLIFLGGAQQELNGNGALDAKILSALDDFIPELIRATAHLR